MTLLKLLLVPLAVWLASLAARRWGHAVSGYLGGMPLIGGPITLYLALEHGAEFAARSATLTLAAILAQGAHLIAFTRVGARARWPAALAAGWASFAVVAGAVAALPLTPAIALACAALGLGAAAMWLPHPRADAPPPRIPPLELRLRLIAAFAMAAAIVWAAPAFGPVVSGILLSVPVTGSIMPPFTLALYGPQALARLARGFVVGLCGFAAFFFAIATAVEPLGIAPAFLAAVAAALVTLFAIAQVRARL